MLYCIDCKHYRANTKFSIDPKSGADFARCHVKGLQIKHSCVAPLLDRDETPYCETQRLPSGPCGIEGRLFAAPNEPPVPVLGSESIEREATHVR